jgi:UPF0716 protein FxsA
MRFLLILAILLAFPVLEIWLLIELGSRYGIWLLAYLLIVAILGWRLLLDEKLLMFGRMAQTLTQGGTPAKALFGSAKNLIAGVLLIIPGILSDVLAVILLLIPSAKPMFTQPMPGGATYDNHGAGSTGTKAANDDVIEGEFRRED